MIEQAAEIKTIMLRCKDCGAEWAKKYRKEYREHTKSSWWRPSSQNHFCEVLKKKSEPAMPTPESTHHG